MTRRILYLINNNDQGGSDNTDDDGGACEDSNDYNDEGDDVSVKDGDGANIDGAHDDNNSNNNKNSGDGW